MANILLRAQKFLLGDNNGYDEDEVEEYDDDEEEEVETERTRSERRNINITPLRSVTKERESRSHDNSKIARIYPEYNMTIVLARPENLDDAAIVVDNVRDNKVCVVNLEGMDKPKAQRIADFLGGACYALNGSVERVSNEIFITSPNGVDISGKLKNDVKTGSSIFPWISPIH